MLNNVIIKGRLVKPAEVRQIPSGKAVADFAVAANERVKNAAGEWEDGQPSFFDCVAWGYLADRVSQFDKGELLIVAGRLKQETWQSKEGQNRSKVKVIASDVDAVQLTRKASAPAQARDEQPYDDDIAF